MVDINLSKAVRSNLGSLQNTASLMSKTSDRLSTGNKVNSALDNPTNFFTASSLNSRAGDLNNLMDSMANGIKTIEAADNGLTAITKTLESMQSTLRQARQDKSFETKSLDTSSFDPANSGVLTLRGGAFDSAATIDLTETGSGKFAQKATYAGIPTAAAATIEGAADLSNTAITGGKLTISYDNKTVEIDIAPNATAEDQTSALETAINSALEGTALEGRISAVVDGSNLNLVAASGEDATITIGGSAKTEIFGAPTTDSGSNDTLDFTINNTEISLDSTNGATVEDAVDTINQALEDAGEDFRAYTDGTTFGLRAITSDAGPLVIKGFDAGNAFGTAGATEVTGATNTSLTLVKSVDDLVSSINSDSDFNTKVRASNDNGKLRLENLSTQNLEIDGATDSGKVTGDSSDKGAIGGNDVRSDLAAQYNELRDQLDKLADDASFNGINLLRGDNLKLTFNETGTSSIDIQTKDAESINASNLNLQTTLEAKNLDSDASIDTFIGEIKTALNTVRSQSSAFGSNLSIVQNRQDFTKSMIDTLETGAGNLTLADMNQEAANMMALQTRQSLASSTLSMANQADQGVLQLLR